MASESTAKVVEEKAPSAVPKDRRYVGSKETFAYILDDIAQSFNIGKYDDVFRMNILKIDLVLQSVTNGIITVWDIINDLFLAAIVDKTRTRWGKFKPWLVVYAIPGVFLTVVYWALPMFMGTEGIGNNIPRFAIYLLLQIFSNLATSLISIVRQGMTSTITPNIIDRTRLITSANLLSGFVEKAPEILMGLLIDIYINSPARDALQIANPDAYQMGYNRMFVLGGVITAVVSGLFALFYAFVAKERVMQTVDRPSIFNGIKSVITNKPLLLITLSEFLGAFSLNSGTNLYYIEVLNLASMATIVGIPGAVVSPISYSYVPWARSKFSTKVLWIAGSHVDSFLMLGVYAAGKFINIGGKKGYESLAVMIPAFMLRETIWMFFWGIRKVIPEEMRNEAIDYGEWKNGFRSEGMTGVAKGLVTKMVGGVKNVIQPLLFKAFGYDNTKNQGAQTPEARYALFFMCTLLPVVTGILSIVPQLFYDLQGEKRDRMYMELRERRKAIAAEIKEFNDQAGEDATAE
ncbi:MAG: MFS transporter [Clostridia bacterium]|nr:MFS transporter [Clostridia bacterium]MBQ7122926.1 MFS transporter [Clostridia bacterium]